MSKIKPVYLISAISENKGIGIKGNLPWRLKTEMEYFTSVTKLTRGCGSVNAVVMGRKTWESIPKRYKPLEGRFNVIISSTSSYCEENTVVTYRTLSHALEQLQSESFVHIDTIWVIGGYYLYKEALERKVCDKLFITHIKKEFECDTFFPDIPEDYIVSTDPFVPQGLQTENGIDYEIKVFELKQNN